MECISTRNAQNTFSFKDVFLKGLAPDGGLFVYPNQQTRTCKDEILEAVGVVPDISIELDRDSLLIGIDNQLEKAINYLNN